MDTDKLLARADAWLAEPKMLGTREMLQALVRDLAAALRVEQGAHSRSVASISAGIARAERAEAALADAELELKNTEAALVAVKALRDMAIREGDDLSAKLAEARGLLERWVLDQTEANPNIETDTRAFLAGRPAPAEELVSVTTMEQLGTGPVTIKTWRADPRPAPAECDCYRSGDLGHAFDCPAAQECAAGVVAAYEPRADPRPAPRSNSYGNPACYWCDEGIIHHPEVCGNEPPAPRPAPRCSHPEPLASGFCPDCETDTSLRAEPPAPRCTCAWSRDYPWTPDALHEDDCPAAAGRGGGQ